MTSTVDTSRAREELIRRRLAGTAGGRRGQIPVADRTAPLPLAFGQQQMWFLNRLEPDSGEYLVPLPLRLRGQLDPAALGRAYTTVLDRHEILRTRYALVDNAAVQVIDPPRAVDLPVVDLTGVPAPQREERATQLLEHESVTGFDLERDWPVRAKLIRLADDDHLLVVVFHHIACDATSTAIFSSELAEAYAALVSHDEPTLPPLPVQYADFAAWQRDRLQGSVLDGQLRYWRERLAGLAPLELPTDRPRPAVRDWYGDAVTFALSDELAAGVRRLATAQQTTLFVTLLTAWQALLSRYTGTSDIPVGTVVSGRSRPELRQMIGYGINSLVLRGQWEGDPRFVDLLAASRGTVLDAFDHAEMPFAQLVDDLQPERDRSRTPLYQVAFNIHEDSADGVAMGGLTVSPVRARSQVAKADLTLHILDAADGGLRGQLEYATALFDTATVERMLGHLQRLLAHVVAAPATRVSELSILDSAELAVLLDTSAEPSAVDARSVHEAFERQVAATPHAVAVSSDGVDLTYAQLNARANRLAHHLRARGAGPETIVGVCLERGPDLVPTLLGVLKSGAGYLPLDPAQPADRRAFMLDDAGAPIVVTTSAQRADLDGFTGATVLMDQADLSREPDSNLGVHSGPDGLIYTIYTSGSTGRPKGCCLTHGNVLRLLRIAERHYEFSDTDVWPLFHSYAFDVSVWELWGSLLYGGRLVVVPKDVTRSPDDLLDLLVEHRVTVLNQTPTAFRGLVNLAAAGDPRIDRLHLRAVVFAGEKLEFGELAPWVARRGLEAPRLLNMYGITETTVHSTFHQVTAEDLANPAGNPVGYPLADLRIHLLDQHGRPVPVGVPGEIYVGGPGVARGYLNRPELTAQRFVPDPFGGPGQRLYRSGDLAKRLPDGSLHFCGRIDDQVKIRGYRIELGEITAALADLPGVRDAVVVVREDTPGDKRLVGYAVPVDGSTIDTAGIRAALARNLPEYMIPAAFVPLQRLPLTTNGKLDKRALPAPGRTALMSAAGGFTAPRTPVEERVAGIWRDVLGVDRVGVHDSFFDLGGDSIRAVGLAGALRAELYDVAVRDIFEYRTVAELSEFVTGRPAAVESAPPVQPFELISEADRAALPDGVVDAYPVSQAQLGMLVEMLTGTVGGAGSASAGAPAVAGGGRNAYHNITTFRIQDNDPVDTDALRRAADLVVSRHEVLRTGFDLGTYSEPLQLVHGAATMPVASQDLRGLAADAVTAALREFQVGERSHLFDLAKPALIRICAHEVDQDGWWLSVTECHPILEGWSHHSMVMELLDCYHRIRLGLAPAEPEPAGVRFADFIAAELASMASAEDRSYWRNVAGGYPRFTLPTGWGEDPQTPSESYVVQAPYHDLEEGLRGLATKARASLKSVMLAVHLKVLSQLTEERIFTAGLVCDARQEVVGADRVYGMYINTLPFPYERGARTWRQLVSTVFHREVQLWPHRRFPLPAIQREAGGDRLIDVYFNYQDFRQVDAGVIDYRASIDNSPTEFPLSVSSRAGMFHLSCKSHALTRANAERVAAMYRAVMEAMVADPDGDAMATCLPPAALAELTAPAAPALTAPAAATVQAAFAAQVERTPHAVAVVCDGTAATYARVNARANQLAHRLRALGVGPGSLVGVCLARGPELVPALLGVLKTGAAYLPLEPGLPVDRLAFMVADAGARVVVTERAEAPLLPEWQLVVLDEGAIDGEPVGDLPAVGAADDLMYVMYTSGSTGTPKGVLATHANVLNFLTAADRRFGHRAEDVWALCHSFAFDVSVWEAFGALLTGGRLVVVSADAVRSPGDLLDLLVNERVTMLNQTPSAFRGLVGLARDGDPRIDRLALRTVWLAGEKPEFAELAPWVERVGLDSPAIYNMYGTTETTVESSAHRITGSDIGAGRNPIGHTFDGVTVRLLDPFGQPVPVGVPGEVFIGGHGVARGYLNRPSLTAERFVPDPFGAHGERLYRSGDLARWSDDGTLEFCGRIDDQVKVRGYRIELGEITACLADHPAVRDVAVIVREDSPGDRRIVAYLVPVSGAAPSTVELADWCADRLPPYMVPVAFVTMDAFPLAGTGKLDKKALPSPDRDALSTGGEYVAPRTAVEERIVGVWQRVLEVDQVGVYDSFFDLGGDSIRAIALVGAVRAVGFDIAVRDVFEYQTVAALAELLTGRPAPAQAPEPVERFALITADDRAALPEGVVDAYPLSQVQLGMLVEMLTNVGKNAYHSVNSFLVADDRPLDFAALRQATDIVTARNENLRTAAELTGYSVPMQLVYAHATVPLTFHDLRGMDADAQSAAVHAYVDAQGAELFELTSAPLARFSAHALSETTWRFTFTQSHAITEGWSYHSMLMELLGCYRAIRDGVPVPEVEPAPLRYADFIAAEQASLRSEDDRGYWRNIVAEYPPLAIPTGWADPDITDPQMILGGIRLNDLEGGLRALATTARVSLKAVFLAAHLKVMSQLTDLPTFSTGLVCDTRPEVIGSERVYGMHLNTLPFGFDRPTGTWLDLVQRVFAREVELWPHRRYPLPAIQREAGRERVINAIFTYLDFHVVDGDRVDAEGTLANSPTEFDLNVTTLGGILGLSSNTGIFNRTNMDRLSAMYSAVLTAMAADPAGDATASYLPPGEEDLLVRAWNPVAPASATRPLHELFEERAAATPDALAVVAGDVRLSYAELNARANRLAHHLRAAGAGPGDLVGVHLERGPELVPALLGVLKSGAAYLPVDPAYPAQRRDFMLADAGARLMVSHSELVGALPDGSDHRLVLVDSDAATIAARPATDPVRVSSADDPIYVIYTSGSTGRPKGVCLTHTNVHRLFTATEEQFRFSASDVWSLFFSYAFDFSVWELWGPLLYGGTLVVVPFNVARSPEDFLDLLVQERVTILNQTPSAFRALVTAAAEGDPRIDRLSLRRVVFGGEKLVLSEIAPWVARVGLDAPALINMYGITETTVHTTYHRLDAADMATASLSPVGRPLADLQVHLFDQGGNLVPIGVPGEIHVGGPGVALAYLNRPELTAQRFVPDPFGAPGERLYRSGDVARRLADGSLEFLGRIDDQVKIRGYRVELGEISAALAAHPGVRDAVVVVRDGNLVGYLIPTGEQVPSPAELRTALGATLPDYMIPAAYVSLERIPLTATGKLDRRALPAPSLSAIGSQAAYVAPRTDTEQRLAEIWAEILDLDRVGIDDGFFDLGGDSLRAVSLVGAMRTAGYDLGVRDVFLHQSVAALASLAESRGAPTGPAFTPTAPFALISDADRALLPDGVVDAYPASQAQVAMAVEISNADEVLYHIVSSFRIRDERPLDAGALRAAVDELTDRHDTLRTSVVLVGYSTPMQLVHGSVPVPVSVYGSAVDHRAYVESERGNPFDLERAPLLRVAAHPDSPEAWWLTLSISHLVTGGWDFNTLLADLIAAYRRHRDAATGNAPVPPRVRFADFIAGELASLASDEDRDYWRGVVGGYPRFTLPTGWGDADAAAGPIEVRVGYHDLDPALRALAAANQVSIKAVLHAAHLKVMSQLTPETSFFTGLIADARPEVTGAETVNGMYINTLPFGHDRRASTWSELVTDVFAREAALWPHRRYPLPAIVRDSGSPEHPVQVVFDFMDYHQVDAGTVDVEATVGEGTTEFGLVVSTVGGNVCLISNTRLLSRANAERLGAMYRAVLAAMAADPDGDARRAYLPDGERAQASVHGAFSLPAQARCLHEAFEQQAAETPHAAALTASSAGSAPAGAAGSASAAETLTYAQVNARANGLAYHLRTLGARPETLVGVCLDRGVELIPALLGILKSGAGYLPMEPGLPDERITFMLADAQARIVVTQRRHADRFAGLYDGELVVVDGGEVVGAPISELVASIDPLPVNTPQNLAYVMYTSGSTGQPKGVAATHANVLSFLAAADRRFGFRPDDVWPMVHSYAFDVSVWESLAALLFGGRLVVVPQDVTRSPDELLDLLVRERATVLNQTPSAFRGLVNLAAGRADRTGSASAGAPAAAGGDPRIDQLALRTVIIAGERPEFAELAPWVARRGLERPALYNMYGITETTVESTAHRVIDGDLVSGANPVGQPFDGVTVHLLDAYGEPVPVGVAGEAYLGGHGIARGYLNRPSLTAERFVPDPFGAPGERLYRSGDLARRLPGGGLEFLGRIDDQVKVRGYRIELGEITAVLAAHPGVREVVVLARTDGPGDPRLVAYLVPTGTAPAAAELAAWCGERLPEYMVPVAFMALDALPLAATGKLDKRALPSPDRDALGADRPYAAPRTTAELRMAQIWADVLGVRRVGVADSFFDLGGDSLRAVALVGALRAEGYDVGVRDVFAHRTVGRLAAAVAGTDELLVTAAGVAPFTLISSTDAAALPAGLDDAYPLSQIQLGMLVELMASEDEGAYHSVQSHRVRDDRPLDRAALTEAVRVVLGRHDVLRTSFQLTGYAQPLQLVHSQVAPVVRIEDGRGLSGAEGQAMLEAFVAAERSSYFDLDAAPLFRVAAHLQSDDTWWLTFTLCHAITEGWSINLLLRELLETYRSLRDGSVPVVEEAPAVRYADFVAGELESLAGGVDEAYWRGIVAEYARFELPAGWRDGDGGPRRPLRTEVDYADLQPRLRELASTAQVSLKAVLHAAHLKVMSQLTDAPAFFTGLVCDARPEALGADRVHGMFLNTLPFAHSRTAKTWTELVTDVFDREVSLWPHRRYPLPLIQRAAGGRLIDVFFNYQDFTGAGVPAGGNAAANGPTVDATIGEGSTEFALSVIATDGRFDLISNTHALNRASAERLAGMYRAVLTAMAADFDGDARAAYLPAGERERLLAAADASAPEAVTRCVHTAFEEQAAATPDAVAVVFDGVELTYAQLNDRANQLAHYLRSRGAGPETLVGVHLARGGDLVPALLGVLKSGAAYLPLDPAQPAERLGFMLADAGVRLVVTTSALRSTLTDVYQGELVVLDEMDLGVQPTDNPAVHSGPDNLIYVIYTSGSTGRPKGVCLTHANVLRLLTTAHEHYAFDSTDVWPLFHSYAFDVSVWELWGSLLYGGRLVVVPRDVTRSPDDFLDLLVDQQVTVLNQTPSAFRGLVAAAADGDPRIGQLALRAVVFAGEKLEMPELRPWVAKLGLGRVALVNMYGITETTVHTTYHRVTRHDLAPGAGNRIGRPLPDLRVHLLDRLGELAPVGVVGEIYVGGPGVARGYLGRPALTAERFVPDPFGPAGGRLYRSGDLARRLPDGSLEFCGRIDDQVKIRGYRVELGEIETALTAHPDVRDAVVLVREASPGDKRIVAYTVPAGDAAPSPAELRSLLVRSLPEYMVPSAFVTLSALPLTPNGKLDKRALPAPDGGAMARREYVAPRTAVERTLAEVWGLVLGVDRVGVHDRFLELGGDSILTFQVVAEALQRGVAVPLRLLYTDRTLEELAAVLAPPAAVPAPADALSPAPADAPLPRSADALSPAPADALSPAPADALSPAPADALLPRSADALPPATAEPVQASVLTAAPAPAPQPAPTLPPPPAPTLPPPPAATSVLPAIPAPATASGSAGTTSTWVGRATPAAGSSWTGPAPRIPSPVPTMAAHRVPGASIVLVDNGEIVDVRAYGTLTAGGTERVTPETVFQTGSVSKLVSAVGALRLVEQGRLDLDADVNGYLTSWRVPDNAVVTVGQLLGHTAGLTAIENHGYAPGEPLPTVTDLLAGRPPVRTPPIRVELVPGSQYRNANVHYALLQQVLEDVTGLPFDKLLAELVLHPLGMTGSSFDQAYPVLTSRPVALGHGADGVRIRGAWRLRPDVAAAGLWSTATDLARLGCELRRAYLGTSSALLQPGSARRMLTSHPGSRYGLGCIVDEVGGAGAAPAVAGGAGGDLEYGHGGETPGYQAMVFHRMASGAGAVVLTNGDAGKQIVQFLAHTLG